MSNLNQIKRDIETHYYSTNNTVERYNFINEIMKHLEKLNSDTVTKITNGTYDEDVSDCSKIIAVLCIYISDVSSTPISTVQELIKKDILPSEMFDELGLDSLDFIELIMYIESEFNIEIDDSTAESFVSFLDLVKLIQNKIK